MKYKRIMSLLASAVMIMSLGTEAVAAESVQNKAVTTTQTTSTSNSTKVTTKTLYVGESVTLSVKGAVKGKIKTSSTKKGIIKVECVKNGKVKVTALKSGTNTVTIKNSEGKELAKYKIVVKKDTDTVLTMLDNYIGTQMYTSEISFGMDDFKIDGDGSVSIGGVVKVEQYDTSDFGMMVNVEIKQTSEDGRLMLSYNADLFKVYFFNSREQMYIDTRTPIKAIDALRESINKMPSAFKEEHGYDVMGEQLEQARAILKFYEEKPYISIPYSKFETDDEDVNITEMLKGEQSAEIIAEMIGLDESNVKDITNIINDPSVIAETLSAFNTKLSRNLQKYASSSVSLSKDKKTAYFTFKPSNTGSIMTALSKFMKNDFVSVINSEIERTSTPTGSSKHKAAMKSVNKILKMVKEGYTEEAAISTQSLLEDYKDYLPEQIRQSGLKSIKIGVTDKSTKSDKGFKLTADVEFNETYMSTEPFGFGITMNCTSKKATKPTIRYDDVIVFDEQALADYLATIEDPNIARYSTIDINSLQINSDLAF